MTRFGETKSADCPTRLGLPIAEWPREYRELWKARIETTELFAAEPAPDWARATIGSFKGAFARFLGCVNRGHPALIGCPLVAVCSPALVENFVADLRRTCRETSVSSYLLRVFIVVSRLDPAHDYSWLLKTSRKIGACAPRLRRPVVLSKDLRRIGLDGLAEAARTARTRVQARSFRAALMVAMFSEAPMRVGSMSKLELSDIIKVGRIWTIDVRAEHAKRRKPAEYELSDVVSRHLDFYISEIRPRFPNPGGGDALWPSPVGGSLSVNSIAWIVGRYTKARLGLRVSPHGFRRAAAAYIAYADPANVLSARDLLGHENFRTTERHYLPAARTRSAGRYLAEILGIPSTTRHLSSARKVV